MIIAPAFFDVFLLFSEKLLPLLYRFNEFNEFNKAISVINHQWHITGCFRHTLIGSNCMTGHCKTEISGVTRVGVTLGGN